MNTIEAVFDAVNGVRDRIDEGASPLAIVDALRPVLTEFAMSDVVLSDDVRARVQDRVHLALRDAGLLHGEVL